MAREQILLDSNDLIGKQDQARDLMRQVKLSGPTGMKDKLALVHGFLWPARETIAHTYPVPADSWRVYLYYPFRFKDMLVKSVKALWWLGRGDPKSQAIAARINQVTELRDWLLSG